ncbi:hypothetical protein D3C77_469310 [compost metagenome]
MPWRWAALWPDPARPGCLRQSPAAAPAGSASRCPGAPARAGTHPGSAPHRPPATASATLRCPWGGTGIRCGSRPGAAAGFAGSARRAAGPVSPRTGRDAASGPGTAGRCSRTGDRWEYRRSHRHRPRNGGHRRSACRAPDPPNPTRSRPASGDDRETPASSGRSHPGCCPWRGHIRRG